MSRSRSLLWLAALAASQFTSGAETLDQRKAAIGALLEAQDYQAALTAARVAQRESKDDVDLYRLLGAAALGLGDIDEAEKQIQWMLDLRIGKSNHAGWMLLARFRDATGDPEGALEALNLAHARAATAEQRHAALLATGRIYLDTGRLAFADQAATAVLAQQPALTGALELRARVRLAQGHRAEAVSLLRALVERSASPEVSYLLATVTRDPADFAEFEKRARAVAGQPANANRELILYLATEGKRPAEALAIARQESARRHDAKTLAALAVALAAQGQREEAEDALRRALASGSRDPELAARATLVRAWMP